MCIFQKLRSKNPAKQFQFSPLSVTNFKIGPGTFLPPFYCEITCKILTVRNSSAEGLNEQREFLPCSQALYLFIMVA